MTPELWQRLKPLYNIAIEMEEPRRAEYIAEACGSDAELREELEGLLRAADISTVAGGSSPFVNFGDVFPSSSNSFSEGELILGRFRIVRHLGTGGMGEVYEANDLELGRIALKAIRRQIAASPNAFERFRQEVALARKVSGVHICRIHELFLLPATDRRPPTAFLTMEYLDGTTLSEKLARDGCFSRKEALVIASDICDGLQLIHQQDIIHRDLKPANIMLCDRGGFLRAVLMDFGLAHAVIQEGSDLENGTLPACPSSTLTGAIAGTPAYMAPEQFEGKAVTPATDIYALGVILYQLLTGKHPYPASTPLGVAMRRLKRPDLPSSLRREIPRHWDRVIERCLEDEPSDRYQSAAEVAKALKASPLSLENLRKDHPWVLRLAGILALAVVAWTIHLWWQSRHYYHPTPEEKRWYDAGLTALREGNNLRATRELGKITQENSLYVMAHARLAEAWANLDFDGAAQREMLIATAGEKYLSPLDRMYLDAIRATLTQDFKGALILYRQILNRLPDSEKAAGYVDLGMAYERIGTPSLALANYAMASKLDPDSPSPYMHTAVLEARLNKVPEADQAFSRAESILTTEMDQEGLADLDYERGYLANAGGDSAHANLFLERSLGEAKQIQSVQLEIRALTQLSSSASASGRPKEGVDYAQQAIQLARDNQLDAWAANGFARLAQARMAEGSEHFQEAEEAVIEAKTLAIQSQQPRAEALANVTLASLRDAEHRPEEVIPPAQAALQYYKQNGYFEPAASATLLLLRADESRGEFQQTLLAANNFLTLAENSGNPYLMMLAEHHLGTTYQFHEWYPDALQHFQKARELASDETNRALEAKNCAGILIKIGQFGEADTLVSPIEKIDSLTIGISEIRSDELLAQGKFTSTAMLITNTLKTRPDMMEDDRQELLSERAVAEAHLHRSAPALADLRISLANGNNENGSDHSSESMLPAVEVKLLTGNAQQAMESAISAEQYFASKGQLDSDLRASLLAASASQVLNDTATYNKFIIKAIDIQSLLEQTWGPQVFHTYLSRPDLRSLMRALPPQRTH